MKSTHTVGQMLMDLTPLPPGRSGVHVVELPYDAYGVIFRGPDAQKLVTYVAQQIEVLADTANVAAPQKTNHPTRDAATRRT